MRYYYRNGIRLLGILLCRERLTLATFMFRLNFYIVLLRFWPKNEKNMFLIFFVKNEKPKEKGGGVGVGGNQCLGMYNIHAWPCRNSQNSLGRDDQRVVTGEGIMDTDIARERREGKAKSEEGKMKGSDRSVIAQHDSSLGNRYRVGQSNEMNWWTEQSE